MPGYSSGRVAETRRRWREEVVDAAVVPAEAHVAPTPVERTQRDMIHESCRTIERDAIAVHGASWVHVDQARHINSVYETQVKAVNAAHAIWNYTESGTLFRERSAETIPHYVTRLLFLSIAFTALVAECASAAARCEATMTTAQSLHMSLRKGVARQIHNAFATNPLIFPQFSSLAFRLEALKEDMETGQMD